MLGNHYGTGQSCCGLLGILPRLPNSGFANRHSLEKAGFSTGFKNNKNMFSLMLDNAHFM
jgi:hypothetical protein